MFTSSTTRKIRHFHFVVVQRQQRNVQKSVMHVQSCCFANLSLLLFCRSRCRRRRRCLSSLQCWWKGNISVEFLRGYSTEDIKLLCRRKVGFSAQGYWVSCLPHLNIDGVLHQRSSPFSFIFTIEGLPIIQFYSNHFARRSTNVTRITSTNV